MPSQVVTPGLASGQRLTVEEFLRRWEELSELKNAELIDGVVYLPSPVSREHGRRHARAIWWLTHYEDATPGCECGDNSTWLMTGSAPQPDAYLRILPSQGGQSRDERTYGAGAPELVVEISVTSTDVDFGSKLTLYQKAGVREYITIETLIPRITWRVLDDGVYRALPAPADGILRSQIFPGLWLDETAFWADDGARMLATLGAGLASDDHRRFIERLAATK
jgi:Uma2 family endonuclease